MDEVILSLTTSLREEWRIFPCFCQIGMPPPTAPKKNTPFCFMSLFKFFSLTLFKKISAVKSIQILGSSCSPTPSRTLYLCVALSQNPASCLCLILFFVPYLKISTIKAAEF